MFQITFALIHHLAHCHSSQSELRTHWLFESPISLSASLLSFFLFPHPFPLFTFLLTFAFSILFSSFLYFSNPRFPLFSPPRPLLIPVCYPSSPCRQRSLTTDSLLPFLLPNPYTTSRYWLHAELPGLRPPPFPLAFPSASPL